MVKDTKTRLTISITKVMDSKLTELSDALGLTRSNIVNVALANFISANELLKNDDVKDLVNNSIVKYANELKAKEKDV